MIVQVFLMQACIYNNFDLTTTTKKIKYYLKLNDYLKIHLKFIQQLFDQYKSNADNKLVITVAP